MISIDTFPFSPPVAPLNLPFLSFLPLLSLPQFQSKTRAYGFQTLIFRRSDIQFWIYCNTVPIILFETDRSVILNTCFVSLVTVYVRYVASKLFKMSYQCLVGVFSVGRGECLCLVRIMAIVLKPRLAYTQSHTCSMLP